MSRSSYAAAIESALQEAMAADRRIIVMGEDVHMLRRGLRARFGPARVRSCPISEAAFLGAAVGAAMGGLRPVVELMLVDFVGVALDALLNQASKIASFSGSRWDVPLVVRAACGGWYGDGGQHEQSLWGLLAGIPGLVVCAPSTPADAAGLMLSSIADDRPVVYLEHKLLSDYWLDYMGGATRDSVRFDVPSAGAFGDVEEPPRPVPLGEAVVRRKGDDLTIVSVAVGVHRALEAASALVAKGIDAEVIDLRTIAPLDRDLVLRSVQKTGRLLVVDEDYRQFGLSGELAAVVAEAGTPCRYARVACEGTLPYARHLEVAALPNSDRICEAASRLRSAGV